MRNHHVLTLFLGVTIINIAQGQIFEPKITLDAPRSNTVLDVKDDMMDFIVGFLKGFAAADIKDI